MTSRRAALGGIVALALSVALLAPASAGALAPGYDLFETDPDATAMKFVGPTTIPPNFFAPGSQAFQGAVRFNGVPLDSFQGNTAIGRTDADTVVRRPVPANVLPGGPPVTIPIELVSLNLVSVEPITVHVGTQTQLWDVKANVPQPSHGQMTIRQQSTAGGTFDSVLDVRPRLTFTRQSDGTTRVLDAPPISQLQLRAENVPWRAGCIDPAVTVPGLNTGFCPGQTPAGEKQLTVEQGQLAQHGILPVQPRLDHFLCYSATPATRFRKRKVTLTDQFGSTRSKVSQARQLCAPAQKNQEQVVNRTAHLRCYPIKDANPPAPRTVLVKNQFGRALVNVLQPLQLCLPSRKRTGRQPPPRRLSQLRTDHFKCYAAAGVFPPVTVNLRDQFESGQFGVLRLSRLCNPVQKNNTKVGHRLHHLACYFIQPAQGFRARKVIVRNQFGVGRLKVKRPRELCVPSLKLKPQPPTL